MFTKYTSSTYPRLAVQYIIFTMIQPNSSFPFFDSGTTLSGDEDGSPPIILGTSTKQPTKIGRKPTKRQKTEAVENGLIQKATECMDKASQPTQKSHADGFEIFGRYIASELRGILNPQAQQLAKVQIQTVLFNAQSESAGADLPRPAFHPSVPPMEARYSYLPESYSTPHRFVNS